MRVKMDAIQNQISPDTEEERTIKKRINRYKIHSFKNEMNNE